MHGCGVVPSPPLDILFNVGEWLPSPHLGFFNSGLCFRYDDPQEDIEQEARTEDEEDESKGRADQRRRCSGNWLCRSRRHQNNLSSDHGRQRLSGTVSTGGGFLCRFFLPSPGNLPACPSDGSLLPRRSGVMTCFRVTDPLLEHFRDAAMSCMISSRPSARGNVREPLRDIVLNRS